jgi:hypothetical protein
VSFGDFDETPREVRMYVPDPADYVVPVESPEDSPHSLLDDWETGNGEDGAIVFDEHYEDDFESEALGSVEVDFNSRIGPGDFAQLCFSEQS